MTRNFKGGTKRYVNNKIIKVSVFFCVLQIVLIFVCTQIYYMKNFDFLGYIIWNIIEAAAIFLFLRFIFLQLNYRYCLLEKHLETHSRFIKRYSAVILYANISAVALKKFDGFYRMTLISGDEELTLPSVDDETVKTLFSKLKIEVDDE